ncbi:MAG: hypothetical protein CMF51_00570 [Legionellales bacterium]|nr:hypothetical protein [Legionellales bacterium]
MLTGLATFFQKNRTSQTSSRIALTRLQGLLSQVPEVNIEQLKQDLIELLDRYYIGQQCISFQKDGSINIRTTER